MRRGGPEVNAIARFITAVYRRGAARPIKLRFIEDSASVFHSRRELPIELLVRPAFSALGVASLDSLGRPPMTYEIAFINGPLDCERRRGDAS